MIATTPMYLERTLDQDGRVEQHADGDEEEHGEGIPQGQRFLGGAMAEFGLAQHHARTEGAEREGDAEQERRAIGDRHGGDDTARVKQLARAGLGDLPEHPRKARLPTTSMRRRGRHFARSCRGSRSGWRRRTSGHQGRRRGREHHQHEHHRKVLDDQPADGDAAGAGIERARAPAP
jgi:hypothetical protein